MRVCIPIKKVLPHLVAPKPHSPVPHQPSGEDFNPWIAHTQSRKRNQTRPNGGPERSGTSGPFLEFLWQCTSRKNLIGFWVSFVDVVVDLFAPRQHYRAVIKSRDLVWPYALKLRTSVFLGKTPILCPFSKTISFQALRTQLIMWNEFYFMIQCTIKHALCIL